MAIDKLEQKVMSYIGAEDGLHLYDRAISASLRRADEEGILTNSPIYDKMLSEAVVDELLGYINNINSERYKRF